MFKLENNSLKQSIETQRLEREVTLINKKLDYLIQQQEENRVFDAK